MPEVTLLTQDELRRLVPLDLAAINCVEQGFKALASVNQASPTCRSQLMHPCLRLLKGGHRY